MPSSQDLQTAIERIRVTPFPDNERAVEIKVILPLLAALGWDIHGDAVRYQYKVSGTRSRNQGVVDMALIGARGPLCFIEAKNADERLDNHVSQLLGYAFYEGVVLCALTNGREWWLYLPREGGKPETRKFAQLNLETDPSDSLAEQMQQFLAKDNLESGQAEKLGKATLSEKRERAIWREMLEKPDKSLVQTVSERIERETGIRPPASRVATLLAEVRFEAQDTTSQNTPTTHPRKQASTHPRKPASTPPRKPASKLEVKGDQDKSATQPDHDTKRKMSPSKKIYGVKIWGEYREVRRWSVAYVMLANEIYKRNSETFMEKVKSLDGRKFPSFSHSEEACSSPASPAKYLEDSDPTIFVYVHGSASSQENRVKKLLETFGYPSDDKNIWETITE